MADPKSNEELQRIYREIAGTTPSLDNIALVDEEQQRVFIAKMLKACMDRTHPMVMMTMMCIALGYMADEHNVGREHLCSVLREAKQTMTLQAGG
jgi:hypothetical protein